MNVAPPLHFSLLRAQNADSPATGALLFVHGILGSGANLRGLAARVLSQHSASVAVLVDLRGHGRSPVGDAPHSIAACAADLCALEASLPCPPLGVIGHSFGGKVALAYHRLRPELRQVALLDSAPDARPDRAGSEQTMSVLELLARAPAWFATRETFGAYIQEHGHSRAIGDWLAMNLERDSNGFRFRPQLEQIEALLNDYFAQDMWDVLEESRAAIDVVVGGRSRVYGRRELARMTTLADETRGRLRVHVLPEAGHWVHADDPDAVAVALQRSCSVA